jgi:hypothetical protein
LAATCCDQIEVTAARRDSKGSVWFVKHSISGFGVLPSTLHEQHAL